MLERALRSVDRRDVWNKYESTRQRNVSDHAPTAPNERDADGSLRDWESS
jgi:hypothetical protein